MITGRTKLQKIIYFSKYLDWNVGEYRLHYYGPFSFDLADTLRTAKDANLVKENEASLPYEYNLTESGRDFLKKFLQKVCDNNKAERTRNLFQQLSEWSKENLELAATIDYVYSNKPRVSKASLLEKVQRIKENYSPSSIQNAY